MHRHTVSPVVVVVALLALAACNAATGTPAPQSETPSPSPLTPSPAPETASPISQPQATIGTLPPAGSWQVELSADELVAAGWPADVTAPGTYTWAFTDGTARLDLEEEDGDIFFCEADMEALDEGFRLTYDDGICGGEVDDIVWTLEDDGLHLALITSNAPLDQQKAYLETKPWQSIVQPSPDPTDVPRPSSGTWTTTASLLEPLTDDHTATTLADGRVLVVGGANGHAQIYGPASEEWTYVADTFALRGGHTATMLEDGRVLVAGGNYSVALATAELFDPTSASWSETGSMAESRSSHTATLLKDGRVLVVGGYSGEWGAEVTGSAEIYDPATSTWTAVGSLQTPRAQHVASILPSGSVLVATGADENRTNDLDSTEIFDVTATAWRNVTGTGVSSPREFSTATALVDGRVLVVGGESSTGAADVYDEASGAWEPVAHMGMPRVQHVAVLLHDGRVLVAGNNGDARNSAEIYDASTDTWTLTPSMNEWRASPSAALLTDGRVLVSGGFTDDSTSAEVFDPARTGPAASVPPWINRCEPGCQGPIAAGTFELADFLPGLQFDFANSSWFNTADYSDEIQFEAGGAALRFWQAPGATSETGGLLADVPRTVDGLTDWFVSNPDMSFRFPRI